MIKTLRKKWDSNGNHLPTAGSFPGPHLGGIWKAIGTEPWDAKHPFQKHKIRRTGISYDILWYLVISYILWYLMISWSEDISRSWNSSGYPADPAPASPPFWRSRFLELGHLWHVPIGSRPPEMPKKSLLVSKKNRWSKICKHRFTYIYLHFTTKLAIDLPPN